MDVIYYHKYFFKRKKIEISRNKKKFLIKY